MQLLWNLCPHSKILITLILLHKFALLKLWNTNYTGFVSVLISFRSSVLAKSLSFIFILNIWNIFYLVFFHSKLFLFVLLAFILFFYFILVVWKIDINNGWNLNIIIDYANAVADHPVLIVEIKVEVKLLSGHILHHDVHGGCELTIRAKYVFLKMIYCRNEFKCQSFNCCHSCCSCSFLKTNHQNCQTKTLSLTMK